LNKGDWIKTKQYFTHSPMELMIGNYDYKYRAY